MNQKTRRGGLRDVMQRGPDQEKARSRFCTCSVGPTLEGASRRIGKGACLC